MTFYYFGASVLGSVVGTFLKFPPLFLLAPLVLWKRQRLGLFFLFFLIANILVVRSTPLENVKNVEFVGQVRSKGTGSVVFSPSYHDGRRWRKLGFDVRVYVDGDVGDILYVKGELRRARGYPRFYVKPSFLATATNFTSPLALTYGKFKGFRRFVEDVDPFFSKLFGEPETSAGRGKDGDSGDSLTDDFVKSGLYHIFCVSGMHVGMLYLFSSWIVGLIFYSRNLRFTCSLIFPTLFVVGSGLNVPSIRALTMLYVSTIFKILDIRVHPVNVVSLTGLVMVILNPEVALSLSFYMSFFATLGILVVEGKKFAGVLSNVGGFLGSAPFVSTFAPVNPFSIVATPIVSLPVQLVMSGLTVSFLAHVAGLSLLSRVFLYLLLPFTSFVRFLASFVAKFPTLPSHGIVSLALVVTFAVFVAFTEELDEK